MATRFYFSSSQTAAQSLGFASWAQVNSVSKMALLTAKDAGEVLELGLQQLTTVGSLRLDRQFVSPAFTNTSFINSALSIQLACREFNAGDNTVTAMAARVVTASGTLRGTLLAATKWFGVASELINNATLRNMAFASGTIVASVTGLPNDRIVIEIGFGDNAGASPEFQARYGAPSAISDHAANMTETTSLVPWVEFASTIDFTLPPTLQLQQLSEALAMQDFRMSGLNKISTEMQDAYDAFRFGRFMLLSDFQRPVSDAVSGLIHRCLDNVFVSAIRNRPLTDQQDVADAFSKLLAKVIAERQDITDAATLTTIAAAVFTLRQLSDDVHVQDGLNKLLGMNQGDTQAASEAFNKLLSKNLTEAQDAQDTLRKLLNKSLTELQHVADTVQAYLLRFVALTDNQAISDAFVKMLGKSIADSQATADAFVKLLAKTMTGDAVDVFDLTLAFRLAIRQMLDSVEVSDALRKMLAKNVGDLGSIFDDRSSGLFKSVGDRQDVTDTVSVNAIVGLIMLAIADTLALSDNQRKALFKNVGDLGGVLDSTASLLNKSLADRQDITDAAPMSRIAIRAMLDSLDVSDRFAKSLLKVLTDSTDALDGFTKALKKVVGDNEAARDEFSQGLSKIIGDSESARDLFSLALSKTITEQQDFSDTAALVRFLRRLVSDDLTLTDDATRTRITNQLILEVLEAQDVSDAFVKKLIKVLGENVNVTDAMDLAVALASPLLREYILSAVAGGADPFGQLFGGKPGMKLVAGDEDDPFNIESGAKGRRQK